MKTLHTKHSGFHAVGPKSSGTAHTAYIKTPSQSGEYDVGEPQQVSGLCSYRFVQASGIIVGVVIDSPRIHTSTTHHMVRIGSCAGKFSVNHNLQPLGLLLYVAEDSSVLITTMDVKSSLLVEVEL